MMLLTPSDWLSVSDLALSAMAMVTSAMVAIWIVDKLQRSLENRQQLKDHLSKEVLSVREQYRELVRNMTGTTQTPRQIRSSFKTTGIYASDLLQLLHTQFGTPVDILIPFQTELLGIATDCEEYNNASRHNRKFKYRKTTIAQIIEFEKSHDKLFNNILMTIYNENEQ